MKETRGIYVYIFYCYIFIDKTDETNKRFGKPVIGGVYASLAKAKSEVKKLMEEADGYSEESFYIEKMELI